MILSQNQVQRSINRLKARFDSNAFPLQYSHEQPLRSELLSTDQLERHAKALAEGGTLADPAGFVKRLNEMLLGMASR